MNFAVLLGLLDSKNLQGNAEHHMIHGKLLNVFFFFDEIALIIVKNSLQVERGGTQKVHISTQRTCVPS